MSEQPLYQNIFNYLVNGVRSGKFKLGDRLPTEKELAEEFGVSRITSKKALNMMADSGMIKRIPGKGSFIAEDIDVSTLPDTYGHDTARQNHSLIGVVLSNFTSSYGTSLLSGIEREAAKNDCFITLRRSFSQQELEEKAISDLYALGVDGIVIMTAHGENYNPRILRMVLDGFPVVFVDRYLKGIGASFVGTDNVSAAKKATDYLLGLGHRHISFISQSYTDTSALEARIDGFVRSHAEHGVSVDESLWLTNMSSSVPTKRGREAMLEDLEIIKRLLNGNPQITCIFAAEYDVAVVALEAVKALGKKVPEDISILCFDGPENSLGSYFFTHIRQKEAEMGATAVKMVLRQINKESHTDKLFLDTELIVGASTRPLETV